MATQDSFIKQNMLVDGVFKVLYVQDKPSSMCDLKLLMDVLNTW